MKIKNEIEGKTLDLIIHAVYLTGYEDGKKATELINTDLLKNRVKNFRDLIKKEAN